MATAPSKDSASTIARIMSMSAGNSRAEDLERKGVSQLSQRFLKLKGFRAFGMQIMGSPTAPL